MGGISKSKQLSLLTLIKSKSMHSKNQFSMFQNKSNSFDWLLVLVLVIVLLVATFISITLLLNVAEKTSEAPNITVVEAVTLDKESYEIAEKKFIEKRDRLAEIVSEIEEEEELVQEVEVSEETSEESLEE